MLGMPEHLTSGVAPRSPEQPAGPVGHRGRARPARIVLGVDSPGRSVGWRMAGRHRVVLRRCHGLCSDSRGRSQQDSPRPPVDACTPHPSRHRLTLVPAVRATGLSPAAEKHPTVENTRTRPQGAHNMSNQHTQTPAAREWSVRIFLSEHDGGTHAEARLDTGGTSLTGTGSARLSPADTDVPEIGDELAAGRALSSLAAVLLRTPMPTSKPSPVIPTGRRATPPGHEPSLRVGARCSHRALHSVIEGARPRRHRRLPCSARQSAAIAARTFIRLARRAGTAAARTPTTTAMASSPASCSHGIPSTSTP